MDDILEFIMLKILFPVLVFGLLFILIAGILSIPSCIKEEQEEKQRVETCFMQEPRTKECEFVLWQHELKMKKPNSQATVMPMPMSVVIR